MKTHDRLRLRQARKVRIRRAIKNESGRPRLTVFRSSKHIYAQIVCDKERKTLASASSQSKELKGQIKHGGNVEAAKLVGSLLGDKASQVGITEVVYDRNGFIFTGRVKALADAVREKGIKF
jgi:large subunit ribosomal protein L18